MTSFKSANQLLREGKLDAAVAAYREAIAVNPGFSHAHHNLGEALVKAGRVDEAVAAFRRAVELNPQAVWSLFKLGELLRGQERFEEAVGFLRGAVELKSDVAEFNLGLGAALVRLGSAGEEAEACLRRAVELNPFLAEAFYFLGVAASGRGQWSEAVEFYGRGLEVNPSGVECGLGLAEALGKLGRWSEAVERYGQMELASGESGEVCFGLGQALGQLGRWEEGVVEYRRAVALGFAGAEVRHHLGYALGQLGRWEEGVVEYRLVVEVNPKSAPVRHQLGYGLMQLGRWGEAAVELRRSVELYPGSAVVWQQLGDVLRELGEDEEAVGVYRRALDLNPKLVNLQANLQRLQGNFQEVYRAEKTLQNLTAKAIQDRILQYATTQKKSKVQQSQKKSTVFRPRYDRQVNNNGTSEVGSNLKTSSSEQSEVEAGLARVDEKDKLYLRLSGIVEDIPTHSKPKVIEKLETLCKNYDNAGLIDWEKVLELGYRLFLNCSSTVIDIGGHAGRHSDIFVNQIGCKQIYIFEPIPSKYQYLVNKYSSNPNVSVKQVALSSSVGKSEFIINHGAPEESGLKERTYNNPELKKLEKIFVATDILDNAFRNVSAIEYIKIDTEGGEIDILKGGLSLINKFRPLISVEYGKPSYSCYGHNRDTLFFFCEEQSYVITDLFGNSIESLSVWRECVDTFYWDYYLVPQEKLSFFCSMLTGKVREVEHTYKDFNYHDYPPRLNLGCGYDIRKGYLNVDFQEKHNPDLCADIKSLHMLPSEYYEEIVAQDCLEHMPRTDTESVLKEWSRLLKTGGVLKLRVPDITAAVNVLTSSTDINHQKGWIQMLFGTQAYTGDYHFTSFTEVLARYYLEEIGFKINEMKLFGRWLLDIIAEKC